MHARRIIAKFPGTCRDCGRDIEPGQRIYWTRGASRHVDCQTARYQASQCTACDGSGRRWNNAPCPCCDGTGSRTVQDYAKTLQAQGESSCS